MDPPANDREYRNLLSMGDASLRAAALALHWADQALYYHPHAASILPRIADIANQVRLVIAEAGDTNATTNTDTPS